MYTLSEIIERLSKRIRDHEVKVTQKSAFSNLSVTQIHYLEAIRHLKAAPPISDLATLLKVTKPTATVALDKLEKSGYITKTQSSDDRRKSYVHLTNKGLKISELHDEIHRGYAKYFEKALEKNELDHLVELLNKVLTHLDE